MARDPALDGQDLSIGTASQVCLNLSRRSRPKKHVRTATGDSMRAVVTGATGLIGRDAALLALLTPGAGRAAP
jgi:hypothetical protein